MLAFCGGDIFRYHNDWRLDVDDHIDGLVVLQRIFQTGSRFFADAFDGLASNVDQCADQLEFTLGWLEEADDGLYKTTVIDDLHGAHLERKSVIGTIVERLEFVFCIEERIVRVALLFHFLLDALDIAADRVVSARIVKLFVLDAHHLRIERVGRGTIVQTKTTERHCSFEVVMTLDNVSLERIEDERKNVVPASMVFERH